MPCYANCLQLCRPFHSRGASWVIRTSCALVTTSGWLDAKIFKIFQTFGPIVSCSFAQVTPRESLLISNIFLHPLSGGPDYPLRFATVKWPMEEEYQASFKAKKMTKNSPFHWTTQ